MSSDFMAVAERSKLDRRLKSRQNKKDEQFAPPTIFEYEDHEELSREEARRKSEEKYLKETFPEDY